MLNFAHDPGKCSSPIGLCKCMSTSMSSLEYSVLGRRRGDLYISDERTDAWRGKMIYPKSVHQGLLILQYSRAELHKQPRDGHEGVSLCNTMHICICEASILW